MQKRNKFYRMGIKLGGKRSKGLQLSYIKELRCFFRERLEWPLTFLLMVILFLSFLGMALVLDNWFSYSFVNEKGYMSEYVSNKKLKILPKKLLQNE